MSVTARSAAPTDDAQPQTVTRSMHQMNTFNRLVTGGIVLAIGVLVYNEVVTALPDNSGSGVINSTPISNTVESAMQLAPVALIVIVAGLILANVTGFIGGGGGGR